MKRSPKTVRVLAVAVLVCLVAAYLLIPSLSDSPEPTEVSPVTSPYANNSTQPGTSASTNTDSQLARLYRDQVSDVQVRGSGTVSRLLADDNDGDRHQRFILELDSGQTLLIAHNVDVAPRLNGLQEGDHVSFYGEYEYSDQGGTIHWTHHDPKGTHVAGWLEWMGKRYS